MPDSIVITGFKVSGRHGVTQEERDLDQEFSVDLECQLDLSAAVITLMERLGLVWDVVRVAPERQAAKAL